MEATITFCIGYKSVPLLILLTTIVYILARRLREVIVIYKVVTRVIWWVDI